MFAIQWKNCQKNDITVFIFDKILSNTYYYSTRIIYKSWWQWDPEWPLSYIFSFNWENCIWWNCNSWVPFIEQTINYGQFMVHIDSPAMVGLFWNYHCQARIERKNFHNRFKIPFFCVACTLVTHQDHWSFVWVAGIKSINWSNSIVIITSLKAKSVSCWMRFTSGCYVTIWEFPHATFLWESSWLRVSLLILHCPSTPSLSWTRVDCMHTHHTTREKIIIEK